MQVKFPILTRRHKQPGLTTKDFGGARLESIHRRIFQIDVVADFGFRHGPAHGRRWLGDSIAPEINNFISHIS